MLSIRCADQGYSIPSTRRLVAHTLRRTPPLVPNGTQNIREVKIHKGTARDDLGTQNIQPSACPRAMSREARTSRSHASVGRGENAGHVEGQHQPTRWHSWRAHRSHSPGVQQAAETARKASRRPSSLHKRWRRRAGSCSTRRLASACAARRAAAFPEDLQGRQQFLRHPEVATLRILKPKSFSYVEASGSTSGSASGTTSVFVWNRSK